MDGVTMQECLKGCQVVSERKVTDAGPGDWYFLRLGDKVIPLGTDAYFAASLAFATQRNAVAFEQGEVLVADSDRLRAALQKIADLIDSEAGEPLDDAIETAQKALQQS